MYGRRKRSFSSSFRNGSGPRPARMRSTDESGSLFIDHKEYVADILGSTSFNNLTQQINPGNGLLFPWLSNIAANYEEYRFTQLVIEYRTLTADIATNTSQIGSVSLAADYNFGNNPFTTLSQMLNYCYAISDKICNSVYLGIECDPRKNGLGPVLYINTGTTIPLGQDIKTYNLAMLQVATSGCNVTGGNIGQLWVHYKVKLMKPKIVSSSANSIPGFLINSSTITDSQQSILNPFGVALLTATSGSPSTALTFQSSGYGTSNVPLYISPNFILYQQTLAVANAYPSNQNTWSGGTIGNSIPYNSGYTVTWGPLGNLVQAYADTVTATGVTTNIYNIVRNASFIASCTTGGVLTYDVGAANILPNLTANPQSGTLQYTQPTGVNNYLFGFWVRIRFPDSAVGIYQITIGGSLVDANAYSPLQIENSQNVQHYHNGYQCYQGTDNDLSYSLVVNITSSAIAIATSGADTAAPNATIPYSYNVAPPAPAVGHTIATIPPVQTTGYSCFAHPWTNANGQAAQASDLKGSWIALCIPYGSATNNAGVTNGTTLTSSTLLVTQLESGFGPYLQFGTI